MDVVLASRNRGKLAELEALLAPLRWRLRLVSEFSDEPASETGASFEDNALLKARHATRASGLPAIADDSGLEVDALAGAPGVDSAVFAGVHGDDAANNRKLLDLLAATPDDRRGARFVCVMAFVHDAASDPVIARGEWRGRILRQPRGHHGFGYDPLFLVPSHGRSSAELAPAEKNRISHRAIAAHALLEKLRG